MDYQTQNRYASYLIRAGLIATFLFASLHAIVFPLQWIGYFPLFLRDILSDAALLWSHSIFEIILVIWLLSGKKLYWAGIIAGLFSLGIISMNLGALEIIFRDIGIACAAFGLAILHYEE